MIGTERDAPDLVEIHFWPGAHGKAEVETYFRRACRLFQFFVIPRSEIQPGEADVFPLYKTHAHKVIVAVVRDEKGISVRIGGRHGRTGQNKHRQYCASCSHDGKNLKAGLEHEKLLFRTWPEDRAAPKLSVGSRCM